jgi:hypothetical protein
MFFKPSVFHPTSEPVGVTYQIHGAFAEDTTHTVRFNVTAVWILLQEPLPNLQFPFPNSQ